jgi:hypothetical protein
MPAGSTAGTTNDLVVSRLLSAACSQSNRSGSETPQRLEPTYSLRRRQEVLLVTIEAVLALIDDDHDMLWEDSCTSLSTLSTQ